MSDAVGFDPERLRERLERSGRMLLEAFRDLDPREVGSRPEPERWSPLEIAAHLLDEEREDFRPRLRSTLEDPRRSWPPIDPQGWVSARHYADWSFSETLAEFEDERAASLGWLITLGRVDWSATHAHPVLGPIRAGDLLGAWVAHDQLHLAQLARTRARLVDRGISPYTARYAGP